MFKKIKTILIMNFLFGWVNCQILIPNGDFEAYSSLPTVSGNWYLSNYWTNMHGTTDMTFPFPTPDYFHINGMGTGQLPSTNFAFANITPYSGDAVMGMVLFSMLDENWREYISSIFLTPMVPGVEYQISFWLSNGNSNHVNRLSSNRFGIHFSLNPLTQVFSEVVNVTPQLEVTEEIWNTNWKQYSFYYTPDSAYNYITLGNFYPDSLTDTVNQVGGFGSSAYTFIDKIEIVPTNPNLQVIGSDSVICVGDSIVLTAALNGHHSWATSSDPTIIISDTSTVTVSPNVTTSYLVYGSTDTIEYTLYVNQPFLDLGEDFLFCTGDIFEIGEFRPNSTYLWQDGSTNSNFDITNQGEYWLQLSNQCGMVNDTIIASEEDCQCYLKVPTAFTPNGDNLNETFSPILDCEFTDLNFKIYNRWGEEMFRSSDINIKWDGKKYNKRQAVDVYYYSVSYLDRLGAPHYSSGTFNLIR